MTRDQLVPHDAAATLGAGGIVALGAKLAEDQRSSPVTARAYPHPALREGTVIIRLEPDAVAAGTDAEMAAFGFGEPEVSKPIGQVRFRTLGFPAWALVNEPKKAKAALEVTDDMRKAKRLVQAKPGLPIVFENLVSGRPRVHAIHDPKFWDNWRKMPAWEFSRFRAVAERGTPKLATPLPAGTTAGQQKIEDLDTCVRYTRELLRRL